MLVRSPITVMLNIELCGCCDMYIYYTFSVCAYVWNHALVFGTGRNMLMWIFKFMLSCIRLCCHQWRWVNFKTCLEQYFKNKIHHRLHGELIVIEYSGGRMVQCHSESHELLIYKLQYLITGTRHRHWDTHRNSYHVTYCLWDCAVIHSGVLGVLCSYFKILFNPVFSKIDIRLLR